MDGLTLEQLAAATQVPVRTIRYYITTRLLPGPDRRGKAAEYGEEHLLRLRLIRRLVGQHVPLEEIGQRLHGLTLADLRALVAEEELDDTMERAVTPAPSPRDYIASLLRKSRGLERSAVARAHQATTVPGAAPSLSEIPAQPPLLASVPSLNEFPAQPSVPASAPSRREMPDQGARQTWRRWELAPGVELHVREDQEGTNPQLIARVLRAARHDDPSDR